MKNISEENKLTKKTDKTPSIAVSSIVIFLVIITLTMPGYGFSPRFEEDSYAMVIWAFFIYIWGFWRIYITFFRKK